MPDGRIVGSELRHMRSYLPVWGQRWSRPHTALGPNEGYESEFWAMDASEELTALPAPEEEAFDPAADAEGHNEPDQESEMALSSPFPFFENAHFEDGRTSLAPFEQSHGHLPTGGGYNSRRTEASRAADVSSEGTGPATRRGMHSMTSERPQQHSSRANPLSEHARRPVASLCTPPIRHANTSEPPRSQVVFLGERQAGLMHASGTAPASMDLSQSSFLSSGYQPSVDQIHARGFPQSWDMVQATRTDVTQNTSRLANPVSDFTSSIISSHNSRFLNHDSASRYTNPMLTSVYPDQASLGRNQPYLRNVPAQFENAYAHAQVAHGQPLWPPSDGSPQIFNPDTNAQYNAPYTYPTHDLLAASNVYNGDTYPISFSRDTSGIPTSSLPTPDARSLHSFPNVPSNNSRVFQPEDLSPHFPWDPSQGNFSR